MSSSSYKIYIQGLNGDSDFQIPIPPSVVNRTANGRIDKLDVIGTGEVLMSKHRELETYSWSSYFPASSNEAILAGGGFYNGDTKSTIDMILEAIENQTRCHLYVLRVIDGRKEVYIDKECLITGFTPNDNGAKINDVYYTITFTEDVEPVKITQEFVPPLNNLVLENTLAYINMIQQSPTLPLAGKSKGETVGASNEEASGNEIGDNETSWDLAKVDTTRFSVGDRVKINGVIKADVSFEQSKYAGTVEEYADVSNAYGTVMKCERFHTPTGLDRERYQVLMDNPVVTRVAISPDRIAVAVSNITTKLFGDPSSNANSSDYKLQKGYYNLQVSKENVAGSDPKKNYKSIVLSNKKVWVSKEYVTGVSR